jgi:hypothetical protein
MKFRFIFWDALPCKTIVDRRFRRTCCLHHQGAMMEAARTSETSVDNYFTRQYVPDDKYKLHTETILTSILAVPWLRSLVAGLSPRRPGFAPGSIHMGFVVDKVALGQVFIRILRFFPVYIIPPSFSKLMSSGECVIC